jgi:DNA-binding MarR family transcriptional regulator
MNSRSDVSRVLFGSDKRIDLLYAIASCDDQDRYPTAIAEAAKVATGATSTMLKKLSEVGLLEPAVGVRGSTLRRYLKTDSVVWKLIAELHDELAE